MDLFIKFGGFARKQTAMNQWDVLMKKLGPMCRGASFTSFTPLELAVLVAAMASLRDGTIQRR